MKILLSIIALLLAAEVTLHSVDFTEARRQRAALEEQRRDWRARRDQWDGVLNKGEEKMAKSASDLANITINAAGRVGSLSAADTAIQSRRADQARAERDEKIAQYKLETLLQKIIWRQENPPPQ
jgi:hypothetical protein